MDDREDLAAIWADLNRHASAYMVAYRDHASSTVLGSLAGGMRATVNRIDTWREQQEDTRG